MSPPAWGQQIHGAPGYPGVPIGAPAPSKTDPLAVTSLVLGIASIPLLCLCYLGVPLSIGGLATGVIALRRSAEPQHASNSRGLSIGGVTCSAVTLALVVVGVVLVVAGRGVS